MPQVTLLKKSNYATLFITRMNAPHLRESWLQSTSASALEKLLDQTTVIKSCYLEIVCYIRLNGQRLNPLNH